MMHDDASAGKSAAPPPPTTAHCIAVNGAATERVMREPAATREDLHRHAAAVRDRAATLKAMVITMGIVISPFLALAFGLNFALGMLAAGLAFTTVVTWSGARRVNASLRAKLYAAAGLNAVLLVVILLVLTLRLGG